MGTCKIEKLNFDDMCKLYNIAKRIYILMDPWDRDPEDVKSPEDIQKTIIEMPLVTIEYLLDMME